jgi:luciferase family oxidoreductase group 1
MLYSLLDLAPVPEGSAIPQALKNSTELAQKAESLGYHRYWLAEHHSSNGLAGSAPEILIGHIAANTRHFRVGAGGVMLSHYSLLKVAESFRVLSRRWHGGPNWVPTSPWNCRSGWRIFRRMRF